MPCFSLVLFSLISLMYTNTFVFRPTFLPVADQEKSDEGSNASVDSTGNVATPVQIHSRTKRGSGPTPPVQGKVTRDDLNAAIEAGDWAVVGATAALLADSTNSENSLSESEQQSSMRSVDSSFLDSVSSAGDSQNRSRELDRLVETGDWEGVVLAAAQFEGSDNATEEDTHYTSKSDMSTENSKRRAEIREEVERLVKRVVPDEIGECLWQAL